MSDVRFLIEAIARVGKHNPSAPALHQIEPFAHFFNNGALDDLTLDARDGSCTRRELLTRFLLLNAVLDQGPDIVGVRQLLLQVTNELYRREVRFLHKPLAFFQEIGFAIDQICAKHASVKQIRSAIWAQENRSNPSRYNLFMDAAKQVLGYAIFRWGVPLALPYLLEHDARRRGVEPSPHILLDYLEAYSSAEEMCTQLKDHERYGLGKAIGDKAAHLFGKWLVSTFRLSRKKEASWSGFSYEVPYDSNAGRVLWRTGYLLYWADVEKYERCGVLRPGAGKGGTTYLRVTNIRGVSPDRPLPDNVRNAYDEICVSYLRSHSARPRKVEIQRIQHAYLLEYGRGTEFDVSHFDDGLIFIGTRYCYNHSEPRCELCPVKVHCEGYQSRRSLITDYRT